MKVSELISILQKQDGRASVVLQVPDSPRLIDAFGVQPARLRAESDDDTVWLQITNSQGRLTYPGVVLSKIARK